MMPPTGALLRLLAVIVNMLAATSAIAQARAVLTESAGAVDVQLTMSRDTMRTVDRAQAMLVATASDDRWLGDPILDLSETNWRLVRTHPPELARTRNGRSRLTARFTIEPFLDGDYPHPTASVSWRTSDTAGIARSESNGGIVRVDSVLPDGDPLGLEPARSMPPLTPASTERVLLWPWIVTGACVDTAVVGAVVVYRRARRREGLPTPIERFDAAMERGDAGAALGIARQYLSLGGAAQALRVRIDTLDTRRFSLRPRDETHPHDAPAFAEIRAAIVVTTRDEADA